MKELRGHAGNMRWLVLTHHMPQDPGALRVKIWRRLQGIGAVALKNAMYVLPMNEQTQEDFEWVLREITTGGGEAAILEARFVDGPTDHEIRQLFDDARDADYVSLAEDIRAFQADFAKHKNDEKRSRETRNQLKRFERKLNEIEAIDFFGANGRDTTAGLLAAAAELVASTSASPSKEADMMQRVQSADLIGKVWVTRRNVHVDRMASAWLVRRWIDPEATFKFTENKNYSPREAEVRFDMFDGEFTHEGDKCTFEVLLLRSGLQDAALQRIAEIVHDIDLKDQKYGHDETAGIAKLFAGIVAGVEPDEERIERAAAMLDNLYHSFRRVRK